MVSELIRLDYVQFFLILIAGALTAYISHYILNVYIKKLTGKTKTDIDDIIIGHIEKPLRIFIMAGAFFLGLETLKIISPYKIWIDRLFFVLAIFLISKVLVGVFNVLVTRWFARQHGFERSPKLINLVIKISIYLIALIILLSHFNIEITPLVATLGIGGLAVGLALQNTLANLFAGIHLISDKPIRVGDYIEIDENIKGYVDDIGWRSTRIRTLPNTIIIVPNAKLAESVIVNDSMPDLQMAVLVQCGVAYQSDLKKVEEVTIDVAKKIQKTVPGAVKDFVPFIRYHTFGDSNINFTVILRGEKFVDRYLITHEFIKALKERYDKEGIEISWPVRKIYYGNSGNGENDEGAVISNT